jgi:predicted DNA-binding transcriptional regulator AlpA
VTTKHQRAPSQPPGKGALSEPTRRSDQRRAQQRATASAGTGRDWVAHKQAPRSPGLPEPGSAAPSPDAAPAAHKQLLTYADLVALGVPWSRSRLYFVMAQGRFPLPVSTGPNFYDRKVWRRRDVERWLRKLTPAADYATPAA